MRSPPGQSSSSTVTPTTSTSTSTSGTSTSTGDSTLTQTLTASSVATDPSITSEGVSSTGSAESSTGETCGIGKCKDIDLLFVYDNSPSMAPKTPTLITAILAFQIEFLPELKNLCSLHVGAITRLRNLK